MSFKPFNEDEVEQVKEELVQLVHHGRQISDRDWEEIYSRVKGLPQTGWSNQPFNDILHGNIGIEMKLKGDERLERRDPGERIMHPSATRAVEYPSEDLPAEERKNRLLEGYNSLLRDFAESVSEDGTDWRDADIRWGILLYKKDYSQFLYFEKEIEFPNPDDYYARQERNFYIYEKSTDVKRFSVTTDPKIQQYFTIPDEKYLYRFHIEYDEQTDDSGWDYIPIRVSPHVYETFREATEGETDEERLQDLLTEAEQQRSLGEF